MQSSRDRARCQRNQLMRNVHGCLKVRRTDYIGSLTRKLCRVILFAGVKVVFTNTVNIIQF